MSRLSATDSIFLAAEKAAQSEIDKHKRLGLSIEYDKRGKHPSMTIRVMPSVKIKRNKARGETE